MRWFRVLSVAAVAVASAAAQASAATRPEVGELGDSLGGLIAAQTVCGLQYEPSALDDFTTRVAPVDRHALVQRARTHASLLQREARGWPVTLRITFCEDNLAVARQYGFIRADGPGRAATPALDVGCGPGCRPLRRGG